MIGTAFEVQGLIVQGIFLLYGRCCQQLNKLMAFYIKGFFIFLSIDDTTYVLKPIHVVNTNQEKEVELVIKCQFWT